MSRSLKPLIGILIALIGLAVLEGTARLVESTCQSDPATLTDPGWQVSFFRGLFDWHEPDPDLLWRFRPNLNNPLITTNEQYTIGPPVSAKKPGTVRILVVGDSSPVGLGLSSWRETFPAVLGRHLKMTEADGDSVEVVNAAVSGYSSEQVRRFVELRAERFEPDLIIVYCGNNDASLSSSQTDREVFASLQLQHVRRFFRRFALYRLLRAALQPSHETREEMDPGPVVRVTPEQYRENLAAIVEWGKQHDCYTYLCVPAVPLLWPAGLQFKVFQRTRDVDGELLLPPVLRSHYEQDLHYCLSAEQFARLYGHGDKVTRAVYALGLTDTLPPDKRDIATLWNAALREEDPGRITNIGVQLWRAGESQMAYQSTLRACSLATAGITDSTSPLVRSSVAPLLFNAGICRLSADYDTAVTLVPEQSEARTLLDSARNFDFLSLRIKSRWEEQIRSFEGQSGVTVVDIGELFHASGGETLFLDHCHPTARGHQLIAEILRRDIQERLNGRN